MDLQKNIDEGSAMVEKLLDKPGIPFTGGTIREIPDESGIYVFSNLRTEETLYVGQSKKGLMSRMKDHWAGTTSSDLAKALLREGIAQSLIESRDWIRDKVAIRWLTYDELGMDIKFAEHFAIGALRPKLNK